MIEKSPIRIATRKSPLALWQANYVRERMLQHWPTLTIELVPMSTSGDRFLDAKLLSVGGKGLFVKELEEALLDGRADLAVHSMKDVPVCFPDGLGLAAVCERHNPLDAFVSDTYSRLDDLPLGAKVGTSSLRRQSQLLALRPDLEIQPLRGNIHTRLDKMRAGEYQAIILAAAGLERMGMTDCIGAIFSPEQMLPACGQGALGIECRLDDEQIRRLLEPLNDPMTARCVATERRVNELLGGNCHTPLAVYCYSVAQGELVLSAAVASEDGQRQYRIQQIGLASEAMNLAETVVMALFASGAGDLLGRMHGA